MRSRDAVTVASFCRRLPAAALRALVNSRSPAAAWRRLRSSNAASGMKTSPRTSRSSGIRLPFSRSGTGFSVRRFSVTSSPVRPSPRVAPTVKRPPSYCSDIASPSSFGSATKRKGLGTSFATRVPHAKSSSRENALSSESIRTRCSTEENVETGRPPGRCVGESGVTSSGFAFSSARSSLTSASNPASGTSGVSKTKYCSLWYSISSRSCSARSVFSFDATPRNLPSRRDDQTRPVRQTRSRQAPMASFVAAP